MVGALCLLAAAACPSSAAAGAGGFHRPVGYTVKKSTTHAISDIPIKDAITTNAVESTLQSRAGGDDEGPSKASRFVKYGNVGNVLVIGLSVALLYFTLTKANPPLDLEYIDDGFCISDETSQVLNSHMLSLYVDLILTVALIAFRKSEDKAFEDLKLNDYFLSTMKIASVAGHGTAHFGLSVMKFADENVDLSGTWTASIIAGVMFLAALINEGLLGWIKDWFRDTFGIIESSEESTKKQVKFLNEVAAPFLAPIALALGGIDTKSDEGAGLVPQLIFGAAAFVFFVAGNPKGVSFLVPIAAAILLTVISSRTLPSGDVGIGFVLIFTSAYVYSSGTQIFLWDEKGDEEDTALTYAINSWSTGLLTTFVGWALALSCSNLKAFGGHVLYDLSIPVTYFILFYLAKYFHSKLIG